MSNFKLGLIASVSFIVLLVVVGIVKLTGPISNPVSFPPNCTLQSVGYDTPCIDHAALKKFFETNFGRRYGRNWGKLLYEAAIRDTCPETCKKGSCTCSLNEQALAEVYSQFSAEAAIANQEQQLNKATHDSLPSTNFMMGSLMMWGGLLNVMGWLIAIPITLKTIPWIKVSGVTIALAIVIVIQITNAWGIFTFSFWSQPGVTPLFWKGIGLFFANPIISLLAFAIGLIAIELATQNKTVGWGVGIGIGALVFLAGAIGVFPQWINTLIVMKSGIDQWTAVRALFAGYILAPGLVSVTLGPLWGIVSGMPTAWKFAKSLKDVGGKPL
jgi:hypothetical protein